nr:hypothetical protein [Tanacetum cinerariifolium]
MAASAIAISLDSSDESVGSPPSRVILFGDIPTVIPSTSVIALETFAITLVISSVALVVEMTIFITPLPATSPFLFIDSSEDSDPSEASDSFEAPPSQDPYVTTVARWRIKITTCSSSPSDFCIALTSLEACITLFFRSPPSSFSSPTDSLPVHSSGLDAPVQAHSGSSTRVVSPRLDYPSVREPRHSEAFCHWYAVPLSTFYPLTTSESSSGDSSERPLHSSSHDVRPSRKRCRSLTDSVLSFVPVMRSLAHTCVDLLPPRKRDDVKDHIKVDPRGDREEFKASAGDTIVLQIDPRSIPMVDEEIIEPIRGNSSSSFGTRVGTVTSVEDMPVDLDDDIHDLYHHMSEVCVDRIVGIETTQRQLEAHQMIASGERAGMAKSIRSLRSKDLKVRALLCIERDRVDSLRLHMSRSPEEFQQIRDDRDDLSRKLRRTMTNICSEMTPAAIEEMINGRVTKALEAHEVNRNLRLENENGNGRNENGNGGNGNGNGNGGNGNRDGRGDRHAARECTYQNFMKCQPLNFKGTEGVVGLIKWCKKMETIFHISNCPEGYQDQPLPAGASPTALSPAYVVDFDPEKDEKDPKEDPAYYPADRGKDDDDESSNDDDNDDDVEKDEEDKEEEEHLAPADPSDVSTDDLVPSS